MRILYSIVELVVYFIEPLMCYNIAGLFFKERKEDFRNKILPALYSTLITVCIFLNYHVSPFTNFMLFFVILSISASSMTLRKARFLPMFTLVSVYYLLVIVFELFVVFIAATVSGDAGMSEILLGEMSLYRSVFIGSMKILLCLFYLFLKHADLDYKRMSQYWAYWLAVAVVGFCALTYFQRFEFERLTSDLASNWLIFLLWMLLIAFIFIMYVKYRDYESESVLINARNEILERNYKDYQKLFEDNRHVIHDFRNHLTVLRGFIQKDEKNKALEYSDTITGPSRELAETVSTGSEIVDIVVNYMAAEAKRRGIRFTEDIQIGQCGIADTDFCAILSNLLDNAIESSEKESEEKRYVSLTMRTVNNMLMIKTRNNAAESARIIDGAKLRTSKQDTRKHGIGLESVRSSVSKYDGSVKLSSGKDYFEVQILFFSV